MELWPLGVPESGKELKYHLLGCTDTSQLNPKLLKLLVQNLRDSAGKFENRLLGPSNKIGPTSFRDLTTRSPWHSLSGGRLH